MASRYSFRREQIARSRLFIFMLIFGTDHNSKYRPGKTIVAFPPHVVYFRCKYMACLISKRKHVFRPGLFQAAKELGCNYSHLRRVVIGERVSVRLMKRYQALKASQGADPAGQGPQNHSIPAPSAPRRPAT
jgi:hypothetical protein